MKLSVYNQAGEVVGDVELADAVFGVPAHVGLMHQVVVAQRANARVGTAATKTRAMVAGTTKKIYKQKGTGRARHGSRKVNIWTGGGVVHGPQPRSYEQHTPKKMRRAAIRSALSVKARDNQIVLLESVTFERPRTKDMVGLLDKLPIGGKVLITLDEANENAVLSARNIPNVHTLPALALNTLDLLNHDYLVATVPAIRQVEQWLGNGEVAEAPAAAPRRTRAAPKAEAPAAEEAAPARRPRARAEAPAEEPTAEAEAPTRRRAAAKAEAETAEKPTTRRAAKAETAEEKPAGRARAAKASAAESDEKAAPKRPSRSKKASDE